MMTHSQYWVGPNVIHSIKEDRNAHISIVCTESGVGYGFEANDTGYNAFRLGDNYWKIGDNYDVYEVLASKEKLRKEVA